MGCIEKEVFEVSTGSDTEGFGGGGGVFLYDPLEEEPLTEHLELDHSLQACFLCTFHAILIF